MNGSTGRVLTGIGGVLAGLSLAALSSPSGAIGGDRIVPGRCIGDVEIGMRQARVRQILGKPDRIRQEHGGIEIDTWLSAMPVSTRTFEQKSLKRQYVSVFFRRHRAVQIEASSPAFVAPGGLTTDKEATAWEHAYVPSHSFLHHWSATDPALSSPAGKHILLYEDDASAGIAWKRGAWGSAAPEPGKDLETVIVHAPGSGVLLNPSDADDYSGTGKRSDPPDAR